MELTDGTTIPEVTVEYPIGHRRRRTEGMPVLIEKFKTNPARLFPSERQTAILKASMDQQKLEALPVHEYVDLYVL